MKVLLVQPPFDFIKQGYGVGQKVKFGHQPPLGLGYIASYLERDGHEVKLLDATPMELSLDETVDIVSGFQPDLVGITVLTNYAESAKLLSDGIKQKMPHVKIVLGGPHATYFFEEILDDMPGIDHVLYGEVETVISDYAKNLSNPSELHKINGLVYRDNQGQAVINDPADIINDLDTIPMPAWHLYDLSLYRPLPRQFKQMPFFTMITSRGCWWGKCKFCFQAGYAKPVYRRHSPERVIEEMEILRRKFGVKEIAFWDDTFIMNSKWIKQFCHLKKDKRLDTTWVASGRCNTMNEEMIRDVYEAGCWSMFMGVESGNQDILDSIEKGITLDQARTVFKAANRIGMETRAAFILGLPGDSPEKARKTVSFAIELDPTYAIFYAAHPRRGTELYTMALMSGQFLDKNFRGMSKVTYIPEGFVNAEELAKTMSYAYKKFYLRPRYWLKTIRQIKKPRDVVELLKGFILWLGLSNVSTKKT